MCYGIVAVPFSVGPRDFPPYAKPVKIHMSLPSRSINKKNPYTINTPLADIYRYFHAIWFATLTKPFFSLLTVPIRVIMIS